MNQQSLKLLVISMGFIIILMSGLLVGLLIFKPAASDITHIPAFGMEGLGSGALIPRAQGDIYAVNLFASWCKPCRVEMPHLITLSKHIAVYGIAVKDERADTEGFLQKAGNPFVKIGHDYAGMMIAALGANGVPETLVLNKDGDILYRYQGALNAGVIKRDIYPLIDVSD